MISHAFHLSYLYTFQDTQSNSFEKFLHSSRHDYSSWFYYSYVNNAPPTSISVVTYSTSSFTHLLLAFVVRLAATCIFRWRRLARRSFERSLLAEVQKRWWSCFGKWRNCFGHVRTGGWLCRCSCFIFVEVSFHNCLLEWW